MPASSPGHSTSRPVPCGRRRCRRAAGRLSSPTERNAVPNHQVSLLMSLVSLVACGLSTTGDGPILSTTTEATSTTAPTTSEAGTKSPTSSDSNPSSTDTTGEVSPSCGNGIVEGDEICDDGPAATSQCDDDCTVPACGDNNINASANETCDDGNDLPGDTCSMSCIDTEIQDVALGMGHTCVRFASGAVRCWGQNGNGQLQLGHRMSVPLTLPAPDLDTGVFPTIQITVGGWHSCRLSQMGNGSFRVWSGS